MGLMGYERFDYWDPEKEVCPALGIPYDFMSRGKGGRYNSKSIDRKDPEKGYLKDNIRFYSPKFYNILDNIEKFIDDDIPTNNAKYGVNVNPSNPKAMIFMPCCHDIKAAWVATVILLSLVVALMKGAINGPVPPTNIVANDAIPPIPVNVGQDGCIDWIFGPHIEYMTNTPMIP